MILKTTIGNRLIRLLKINVKAKKMKNILNEFEKAVNGRYQITNEIQRAFPD